MAATEFTRTGAEADSDMADRIGTAPSRRVAHQQSGSRADQRPWARATRVSHERIHRPGASGSVAAGRTVRLPEVVLGVLLVAGCALGAAVWHRSTNTTSTVVVAAGPVARGAVITADDLRGAEIGGEIAAMIPGSEAHSLLGRVALVDIGAGVPFSPTLLTGEQSLAPDEALTSIALEPGRVPPDLARDDHVRIIVTTASDVPGVIETRLLDATAVVWAVDPSQDGISLIVTVRGPLSLSTDVAASTAVRLARVDG